MNIDDTDTLDEDFVIELESDTDKADDQQAPVETQEVEETQAKENEQETNAYDEGEPAKTLEDEQDLSEEDRSKLGNRAQKRIQRLVRQRKETEAKNADLETRLAELEHSNREFDVRNRKSHTAALKQHASRLGAQEEQANQAFKVARENGDIDMEMKANDVLATVKAEKILLARAAQQAEQNESANVDESSAPARAAAAPTSKPDRRAMGWQRKNLWFGGDNRKDQVMTQTALDIHEEILAEGINPQDDVEEYYAELDQRLATEFPTEFSDSVLKGKGSPVVGGGTRSTNKSGKKVIRLTKSEIATAGRLGITPEAYARGKTKQSQART